MNNVDIINYILDILEKNPACSRREICDRLHYDYKERPFFPTQVTRAIAHLIDDENYKVREEKVEFPNIIPFKFTYRLDCWNKDIINDNIVKKVEAFDLLKNHSNRIGDFLELEVSSIMKNFGYEKVERRKESHKDKSIYPEEIDVYCHHKSEPNLAIQVKNRKSDFMSSDLAKLQVHQWKAITNWWKSTTCAIVTSFINDESKKYAATCGIPWVETREVYIPSDVWKDYKMYQELCSANYYVLFDDEIHKPWLSENIYQDIVEHKYLMSIGRYPLENISVEKYPSKSGIIYPELMKRITNPKEKSFYKTALWANFITSSKKEYDKDMIKMHKPSYNLRGIHNDNKDEDN